MRRRFFKPLAEKTERSEHKNTACIHFAELMSDIHHGFSGGNNIIYDNYILTGYISSDIFMRYNRSFFRLQPVCNRGVYKTCLNPIRVLTNSKRIETCRPRPEKILQRSSAAIEMSGTFATRALSI